MSSPISTNPSSSGGPMTAAGMGIVAVAVATSQSTTPASPTVQPSKEQLGSASRFLAQATAGYSRRQIDALASRGLTQNASSGEHFREWLSIQFSMPRPQTFWDWLTAYHAAVPPPEGTATHGFDAMMWAQLIRSEGHYRSQDQLRQRVGMALFSMWVVSIDGVSLVHKRQYAMAAYLDVLWDNAFGNYRDIMEKASTSPAMGIYLSFVGNASYLKAKRLPDENFARELMQLFTIGPYQMNDDGTPSLTPQRQQVPNYTQDDITECARVWTGYAMDGDPTTDLTAWRRPMRVVEDNRDKGAISFLKDASGKAQINIAADTSADLVRKATLDGLFNHRSLPGFVCRQLIQHLVTSNPSREYVAAVSAVFKNNGQNVRGDMRATITAILMHPEARDDAAAKRSVLGKLREPIFRMTHWARAFDMKPSTAFFDGVPWTMSSLPKELGQAPGRSPSVFNWFRPGYVPPNTSLSRGGYVAPTFQITHETTMISYINRMAWLINSQKLGTPPDYSSLTSIAHNSKNLLEELNLVLAANQIGDATIAKMESALDTIVVTDANKRVACAILMVMSSPEYLVLR